MWIFNITIKNVEFNSDSLYYLMENSKNSPKLKINTMITVCNKILSKGELGQVGNTLDLLEGIRKI